MSRDRRKQIIEAIEKKRGSKLITYITSDRQNLSVPIAGDIVSIIHKHILAMKDEEQSKIDLFIYSRGGHSDVPWTLVSMFREYCKNGSFNLLIPYKAHSAATVIALGADEIVMTKKAELGPIDITMNGGPYNPTEKDNNKRLPISVEDVMGYFSLLEKIGCTKDEDKMSAFTQLTNNVHPLALGTVRRLLEQTELVALKLLGMRNAPYTDEKNKSIIFGLSSQICSHSHTICRTEAVNQLGIEHIIKAEDCNIDKEIWELYEEYNSLFELDNPFMPEQYLLENNLEDNLWTDLNLACIESINRLDLCKKNLRVRMIKKAHQNTTLNLSNINMPALNIPTIPNGITPQDLSKMVEIIVKSSLQTIINNAAILSAEEFLKRLPAAGFEQINLSAGWVKED